MVDDALALYRKAVELAPDNPQYHEYLGEYLHNLKRPDEAMAAWAKIADGHQQERQEPGPAGRGAGRLRLRQGGDRAADRGRRARQADNFDLRLKLAELSAPARAVRRRRGPAGRRGASWPRQTSKKTPSSKHGVKNDQAAGRLAARIEALAQGARRRPRADRRAMGDLGPLPRGRRQAARGGPGRRPGDRRSSRDRSRPGRWRPASASRPAAWATPPTPCAGWPRSTAATATEHLTGIAKLEIPAGPRSTPPQGRPRPAGRRAGQSRALRVLRPALLPARPVGGRARRPAPRRAGQPQRHQDHPRPWPRPSPASTRPRRPSRCTGGPSTRPTTWTTSSTSSAADRAVPPAQPVRPAPDPAPAPGARRPAGASAGPTSAAARRGDVHGAGAGDLRRPGRRPLRARAAAGRQHPRHRSCSSNSPSWPRKRATSKAPPGIRSSSTTWPPATRA